MGALAQDLIVAVIVVVAATYAIARFLPATQRAVFARALGRLVRSMGGSPDHARRVETKLASGGACGSCDSCGACAPPPSPEPGPLRRIPIRRVDG